jgi:hypothetical protein
MSQQVNDKFIYNNDKYELISIEFPKTFIDWESFDLNPVELSTACWRGFINTFAVIDDHLVLDEIYTNNQTLNENEEMVTIIIPKINNLLPKIEKPEGLIKEYKDYRILTYKGINYKMSYNGSLLIVKDYIDEYVSGPYAFLRISPFCYEKIVKLKFSKGKFINYIDFSDYGEKIRNERKTSKIKSTANAYWEWPDLDVFYKKNNA